MFLAEIASNQTTEQDRARKEVTGNKYEPCSGDTLFDTGFQKGDTNLFISNNFFSNNFCAHDNQTKINCAFITSVLLRKLFCAVFLCEFRDDRFRPCEVIELLH